MHDDLDCDWNGLLQRRPDCCCPDAGEKVTTPIRKIIGDLSNDERVLIGLDINLMTKD